MLLLAGGRLVGGDQHAGGGRSAVHEPEGLIPATVVRAQGGKVVTTDGPFAETKEQLGGYYLLDCKDLDDALAWAKKIPMPGGTVEVRPVMDYEAAGSTVHRSEAEAAQ